MNSLDQELENVLRQGLNDFELLREGMNEEEKKNWVEQFNQLYRSRTEKMKADAEIEAQKEELRIKQMQAETDATSKRSAEAEAKKRRIGDWVIGGLTIFVPIVSYNTWLKRGLEFEKTGTFTSNMVRGLLQRIHPKK